MVRRIFDLCIKGFAPTQIADILTNDNVPTPTEYWISQGLKAGNPPAVPGKWVQTCVADMLERQEYVGDTVNFRYTTKSFKNKTRVHVPEENWKIFENTHPAIIYRETFAIVKELARKKRELEKTEKRIAELDKLFMRIYEDNVSGKLSDDHFSKMSIIYEDEQKEKKALAERPRAELDKDKEQNDGIEKFITKVKAITDIKELTPEIVREFVSKIVVHAPYRKDKRRHQQIDVYYHGVGIVYIPEPEEVEEMFQEHLRDRKQYMKEKTA